MRLPTVRVRHPILDAVTINASDFGSQHELHPEQADDFDPRHLPQLAAPLELDPAVRDLAAEIMIELTQVRLKMVGKIWNEISGPEQLAALRDAEADVGDLLAIRQVRRMAPSEPAADEVEQPALEPPALGGGFLNVAKGPRGFWYVSQDDKRVSQGYRSEAEAWAEHRRMSA